MAFAGSPIVIAVAVALALAGMPGHTAAQMQGATGPKLYRSPIAQAPRPFLPAGLWDKPNEACMAKCDVFAKKGCFKRLSEKDPTADPAAIQDRCDDKYSVCLYDCMCDTCDENQIIIKPE